MPKSAIVHAYLLCSLLNSGQKPFFFLRQTQADLSMDLCPIKIRNLPQISKDVVVDLYSGLSYHEKKLQGFKAGPKNVDVWKPVSC